MEAHNKAKVNIIKTGMNSIPKDAWFLRVKGTDNYISFEGDGKNETSVYRIIKGNVGACIFTKSNANNFINESGANIEAVSVHTILGNDGTLN